MLKYMVFTLLLLSGATGLLISCNEQSPFDEFGELANGWRGEIVADIDQSYAGWDVEIGDADNDGIKEILVTGAPDSRLYLIHKNNHEWVTKLLADRLANNDPGMGLAVKILDLNQDGRNEILVGTGQETGEAAYFYTFRIDEDKFVRLAGIQADSNKSSYTHNFASYDVDGDGILEIFSAYCSGGEVIRYDFNTKLEQLKTRKVLHLSGSGEESLIADVDNDGTVEYITSNGFRKGSATVEIFEFDGQGELEMEPRIVLDGFDGKKCFYASIVIGDVDNDGKNELIVGWKVDQQVNLATLIGYQVDEKVTPLYTFAYEDENFDLAYFEKMMEVADADNDGKNELIVSTRGDELSEAITSKHLGRVYMFSVVKKNKAVKRELLVDFNELVESSWIAVGDADNDDKNEIIIATGKGDRTQPGKSHIVLIEKKSGIFFK